MMTKIRKTALCMAMLMALPAGKASAAYIDTVTGDLNGDGLVDVSDMVVMTNYIHGKSEFTQEQYESADVNFDNSVDSLDLAGMRYIVLANSGKMPVGAWAILGNCEDYFYFDGEGNVNVTHTYNTPAANAPAGTVTENKVTVESNKLVITGETVNREYTISWVNSNHFDIIPDSGIKIPVVYYGSQPIVYEQLLNGTWISDSGRDYSIAGVNGCYTEAGAEEKYFNYKKDLNRLTFHFGDRKYGYEKNAYITAVDSMHIDLTWDDGTVERLTKRNIEKIDGITYVNGILIANKTYDLPSTYNPGGILPEAQAAFNEMKAAAWNNDRISLDICSGFRSYSYQSTLYNNYVARDGKAAADTYSARAGHSEHQTGLAMDINMAGSAFDNTPAAKWLAAHCAEYGFIIRYPQGKQDITGYKYESWHVRYLGKKLAKEVTDSGLTLEEFLCIDSVYKY